MIRKIFTMVVGVFFYTTTAFGWGAKGHDIVAEIATRHLTPEAKEAVTELLDGRSLVYYSSWMDDIRSFPEYKYTSSWHYINVDKGETYDSFEKNPSGDVYTAVRDMSAALASDEALTDSAKAFYVKALIHFVGDMHCPMHAGYQSDLGGNKFRIEWFGNPTSLHKLWDSSLIESSHHWSYSEWADNIDYMNPEETMQRFAAEGDMRVWLDETLAAAQAVYDATEEGENYSWTYIRENKNILEEQLLKGGYRLAYILNTLFK